MKDKPILMALVLATWLPAALAHHGRAHYGEEIVEMSAEIIEISWRNPVYLAEGVFPSQTIYALLGEEIEVYDCVWERQ